MNTMPRSTKPEPRFPLKLTQAQRKLVAALVPAFADRLELDSSHQRTLDFTRADLKKLKKKAETAIEKAGTDLERRHLQLVFEAVDHALTPAHELPSNEIVYQFKITLQGTEPPVWRRIQVRDGTLDQLHGYIQTAMGWTNSHLHAFRIGDRVYGDPMMLQDTFDDTGDSTTTQLSDILPKTGRRFRFQYEYDFGDSWHHEVLFEGVLRADSKVKYPLCLEGARACPPEDVGGIWGYADLLQALQKPTTERQEELLEWLGEEFDPEAFDAAKATKAMRSGLLSW
jgi:hypothetical protein